MLETLQIVAACRREIESRRELIILAALSLTDTHATTHTHTHTHCTRVPMNDELLMRRIYVFPLQEVRAASLVLLLGILFATIQNGKTFTARRAKV